MITFWRPLSIGFFWDSSVTRKRQTQAELLRTLPWHEASALRHETVPYLIAAERATYLLQDRARRDRTVCARRAAPRLPCGYQYDCVWSPVAALSGRSGARCLFACVEPSAVLFAQHPEEPRRGLWVHLRKEESRQKSLLRPPRPSSQQGLLNRPLRKISVRGVYPPQQCHPSTCNVRLQDHGRTVQPNAHIFGDMVQRVCAFPLLLNKNKLACVRTPSCNS